MARQRWLLLLLLAAFLILELALVWWPFDVRTAVYRTPWRGSEPVGELVAGFEAAQSIPAGLTRIRPPGKKSVHWHGPHSLRTTIRPNCFAVRFATYMRTNAGHVEATWRQGATTQAWRIDAADLVDNDFVDFCPDAGIDLDRPAMIGIRGVDGRRGSSATAWLTRSKLEPASIQGTSGDRSLALELTYLHRVVPRDVASVGRGAFLLGCVASFGIALLALLAIGRRLAVSRVMSGRTDA